MILDKDVEDFFEERKEYLKIPPRIGTSIGLDEDLDIRDFYRLGEPCFVEVKIFSNTMDRHYYTEYYYKDENDDEYYFKDVKGVMGEKAVWCSIQNKIKNGQKSCNVKKNILEKEKKRIDNKKKKEDILENVTPHFLEDDDIHVFETSIFDLFYKFCGYWYGLTGCRGVLNKDILVSYINNFINSSEDLGKISIENCLENFEKQIRNDGGIVEVNHPKSK